MDHIVQTYISLDSQDNEWVAVPGQCRGPGPQILGIGTGTSDFKSYIIAILHPSQFHAPFFGFI